MLISESYRELNSALHAERPDYGIGGHRWAGLVQTLARRLGTFDVLDYGCGKATLAAALPSYFNVRCYDPAMPEHATEPEPADLVICTDVLEHIEPECLPSVLAHLAATTRLECFVNISTRPAVKVLRDGRNAHLSLHPPREWLQMLVKRFDVREWRVDPDASEVNAILWPA